MTDLAAGAALFLGALRTALLIVVGLLALVCVLDWLARTRRISPFNPIARFLRSTVDPFIAPVERRILRAGGLPSSAPWWTLGIAVLLAILILTAADFVVQQLAGAVMAFQSGPRGIFILLVEWTFAILRAALLVRVVVSWLPISPFSRWVRWAFALTEPFLAPLRQVIPTFGMLDLSPLIAYFLLGILERLFLGASTIGI